MPEGAVKCPFYGYALVPATASERPHFGAALVNSGGNQCALITSAHSPCWMEVGENRAPKWEECPRNPEFVAMNIFENLHTDKVIGRQGDVRMLASVRDLNRLVRISHRRLPLEDV